MDRNKTNRRYNSSEHDVVTGMRETFGVAPEVVASAPGRLEILGNHTDYNEGLVLGAAVDRRTFFGVARAGGDGTSCRVKDLSYGDACSFQLSSPTGSFPAPHWSNYIKGVVYCLLERGVNVPPFDACLLGEVPLSAGMSSSAALEMAVAYGLLAISGETMSWREIARLGQKAENEYVGANTGLLDQYTSICGENAKFVVCDFQADRVTTVPAPEGLALLVANSNVKRSLTNEYNERRRNCEEAVSFLRSQGEDVVALRDVDVSLLNKYKDRMAPAAYYRALHVVGECDRVARGLNLLQTKDSGAFGELLYASHESSKNNFENSTAELDLLVDLSRSYKGVYGARLSGGGFGGITIHLMPDNLTTAYGTYLREAYRKKTGVEPDITVCHAAEGAVAEKPGAGAVCVVSETENGV